jgi:NADH-quinone oxidoreductase subunit L
MTPSYPLYLIPLLPLLGALFNLLVGRRAGKNAVTLVGCGSVAGSMLLTWKALGLLAQALPSGGKLVDSFFSAPWIKAGDISISAGLVMDNLSAVLCMVVTGIGLLIHIYSTAYMEHEERYTRFFGYLNLFMGSMLILVLGDSLPVTFIGWEGVGLCSYLLIGFYYEKSDFAYAGRKAFVVNRIGDFGLLLAMFLIFTRTGTLKYAELGNHLQTLHDPAWMGLPAAYFIGLLVLVGAMGKSAQIPLYVWLPDAMAGPTPVSALIHAATMVTAGVYVVARMHVVFELAPATLAAVAWVGAFTALFAATIGFAQRDLKKVLAYSTISQLGFMFVGVGSYVSAEVSHAGMGSSNYHAGVLHLMTHAFFKAGLFLGAGSVMHAMGGEGDIMKMGGLKKYLPHTRWTFLIFCLAIAGIFPFAGFWSKDAILAGAHAAVWPVGDNPGGLERFFADHSGHMLYGLLLLTAGCTSFYMFRLYFLVFSGEFRGTHEQEHHLHESPPAMTVVLWILAIGSIVSGLVGIPEPVAALGGESLAHYGNLFGQWLTPVMIEQVRPESAGEFGVAAGIATLVSLAGIGAAYALYGQGISERVKTLVASIEPLRKVVYDKYYVDEFYDLVIVRPLRFIAYMLWKVADTFLIDGVVNLTGYIASFLGRAVKFIQNGDVQRYVVGVIVGAGLLLYFATNWTSYSAVDFEVKKDGQDVTVIAKGGGPTGQRLKYRIRWEDGGDEKFSQPQSQSTFKHHYDMVGKKKITVEAADPRWGTVHRETHTVPVN